MRRCRSCGAPIRWERTEAGKPIPLDVEPVETGNLAFREDGKVIAASKAPPGLRYVTHFATCPNASAWRKT